ncbi:MAG: YitT family protein [Anaerolineae bacterium]
MRHRIRSFVSKIDWRAKIQNYALLTLGAVVLALNANLFLAPARLTPGGLLSISIIINEFTGWPLGVMMLILNIPMVALGFRYLGRFRFLTRTVFVVALYSLGIDLLAQILPPRGLTDNLLLNAVYAGVVGGVGTGFVYRGRGTPGGTGVLGRVLQLKSGVPISQVYLLTNGLIILAAVLVFGWERALFAFMTLFIWGLAADYILEGPSVVRTAFIITDSARDVSRAVINQLGLGITAWPAQGMFTETDHVVLFCTVSRPDVNILREMVAEIDPRAFVVIGHGHQATGGVFRHAFGLDPLKGGRVKPRPQTVEAEGD